VAATVWWPLSARMAIALLRAGCRVSAVCPTGHTLRCVAGLDKIYAYKGLNSLGALEQALRDARPDIVVPCDDGVVWQLHALHALRSDLRPLIEASIGSPESYAAIRSRGAFLDAAASLGIRVPPTRTLETEQELEAWCITPLTSAVLKLDGTWGGTGVEVVHTKEEALNAFRRMKGPRQAGVTAWKRLLINRDPLALWTWRKKGKPVVTIQTFIPGRPANTMFLAWRGELIAAVTVEVLCAQGERGAATVVRVIENEEILRAAKLLAKYLGLSGFHGLDFILDEATGAAWLIELNPRSTQLGHLMLPGRGDLAGALYTQLSGKPAPPMAPITGNTIALFPQASLWNPNSPLFLSAWHDMPREEPLLMAELLLSPWPERQWASRVYHSFRRAFRDPSRNRKREQAAEVESVATSAESHAGHGRSR
jgi:hypothetical protein